MPNNQTGWEEEYDELIESTCGDVTPGYASRIKFFITGILEREFFMGVANGRQERDKEIVEMVRGMREKSGGSDEWDAANIDGWNSALSALEEKLKDKGE